MTRGYKIVLLVIFLLICYTPLAPVIASPPLPTLSDGDLSSAIPSEWMSGSGDKDKAAADRDIKNRRMDMFSWRAFIALSWPVLRATGGKGESCENVLALDRNGSPWTPNKDVFPTQSRITVDNCPRWM